MSALFTLCLFFLSFAPLWLSVLFLDGMSIYSGAESVCTEWISIVCILLGTFVSCLVVYRHLKSRGMANTMSLKVLARHEEKTITAEFLLSYILPLFAFDFTVWKQVVLFLIFFCTLAFLCVSHRHFSANVVLELAGYRFYRCTLQDRDGNESEKIVVSRKTLAYSVSSTITVRTLNNEYLLACSPGTSPRTG